MVSPFSVADQLPPTGKPVSTKVMEESAPKAAVTAPGASIVIVVDELVVDPNVIESVEDVHETKT